MSFASVAGLTTHYAFEGPGDGPALVFVNSLGTDLRIWDPLLAEASRRQRAGGSSLANRPLLIAVLPGCAPARDLDQVDLPNHPTNETERRSTPGSVIV